MFTELQNSMGVYKSMVDNEAGVFCMDFNPDNTRFPEEFINYAYNREVHYLKRLNKYQWCPELLDTNDSERKVYFKWYNNTCEERVPNNHAEQLLKMVSDLHREQIHKPAFYTKCFYTDNHNILKGFSWYSASDYVEQPLSLDFFRPMLNQDRLEMIEQLAIDGKLDVAILMKKAFTEYIKWPDNVLPKIYEQVYGLS